MTVGDIKNLDEYREVAKSIYPDNDELAGNLIMRLCLEKLKYNESKE